jgi:hypothetical protein
MYLISLTAKQHTLSTVYTISVWHMLPNGGKEPLIHTVSVSPGPNEGLFEESPGEAVRVALAHLTGLSENIE